MQPKIGDKIRFRRKELGYTLKELAGNRITPAQISAIENGKCNPSPGLLSYLCERMSVNADYFTLSIEERHRIEFNRIKVSCQNLYDSGNYKIAMDEIKKMYSGFDYLTEEQKGFFFFIQGEILYESKEFAESFNLFVKSLAHYIKTADNNKIADTYIKIGNCLYCSEKYKIALGYYINASTYINKDIDNDIIVRTYYNLGICYIALNRVNLGKEYVDKCLKFMDDNVCSKKNTYLPGIDMMKGLLLLEAKDNNVSFKNFEDAFEKYKSENNVFGMGQAKNSSAISLWKMGKYEEALEYFDESLKYQIQTDDEELINTYLSIVEIHRVMGRLDRALETINIAEAIMINNNSSKGMIEVFKIKFELLCETEEYERAEIFAFLALDAIQKSGNTKMEPNLYIKLSEMYKKMGDEESSIDYILKANSITVENKFLN